MKIKADVLNDIFISQVIIILGLLKGETKGIITTQRNQISNTSPT